MVVAAVATVAYLADRTQDHEETTEEEEDASASSTVASSASPSHQVTGERREAQQETDKAPIKNVSTDAQCRQRRCNRCRSPRTD